MNDSFEPLAERLYRILFDENPDCIALVQNGLYRTANASFTRLFGYDKSDFEDGLKFTSLLLEQDREAAERLYNHRTLGSSLPQRSLWEVVCKDGKVIPCEVAAKLIQLEGAPAVLVTIRDMPERVAMERKVRSSEARYGELFANVLEGVYQTTSEGEILTANPALVSMLGYESEQQFCESVKAQQLYADPAERTGLLKRLERDGLLRNVEYDLVCKDGSTVTVLENARAVKDDRGQLLHYEGVLTDISEKRSDEKKLRDLHDQLSATLEALPDMLFETDRQGRILDFRAPEPQRLYANPEDFLGKRVSDVLPEPASSVVLAAIAEASQSGTSTGATYSLDYPKGTRWYELSMAVKGDPKGSTSSFIGLVHDITELKRTEAELRRTTHELEAEKLALNDKNTALHQVLDHLESRTTTLMAKAYANVESAIRPIVKEIFDELPPGFSQRQKQIEASLDAVFQSDADDFQRRFAGLTSRQAEICRLVAQGLSSKEIASALNTSPATVNKHREFARKKLGLTGKSISLSSYLRSHLQVRPGWLEEL